MAMKALINSKLAAYPEAEIEMGQEQPSTPTSTATAQAKTIEDNDLVVAKEDVEMSL